jgi:hypothetical protein
LSDGLSIVVGNFEQSPLYPKQIPSPSNNNADRLPSLFSSFIFFAPFHRKKTDKKFIFYAERGRKEKKIHQKFAGIRKRSFSVVIFRALGPEL